MHHTYMQAADAPLIAPLHAVASWSFAGRYLYNVECSSHVASSKRYECIHASLTHLHTASTQAISHQLAVGKTCKQSHTGQMQIVSRLIVSIK